MNAAVEKVRVHWSIKLLLHCAVSGKVPRMKTLSGTRDLNQAIPILTNSVLSVNFGVHSWTLSL